MTIYNIGSINVDNVYQVARLPAPGETLRAMGFHVNLGGKGVNISVAIARAGCDVRHIGAIGAEDSMALSLLEEQGIDCSAIARVGEATGHAIVYVDDKSENQIVVFGGANHAIAEDHIRASLAGATPDDWLVLQNETNANEIGLTVARKIGMKVALVAAPFDVLTMPDLIRRVDLASMNKTETEEFEEAVARRCRDVDGPDFLITYGQDGAEFAGRQESARVASHRVEALDTTGAGDAFFGSFLAKYARGQSVEEALAYANAAAALQVQKMGACSAIPTESEVNALLNQLVGQP